MKLMRYHSNRRMSRVVELGPLLYLCGQVPPPDSRGIEAQTRLVLESLDSTLEQHGSDNRHILSALVHIADMRLLEEFNALWDGWIPPGDAPARTCVEARMTSPNTLIEVTLVAVRRDGPATT